MRQGSEPLFDQLPHAELLAMRAAGQRVLDCRRALAKDGDTVLSALLRHVDGFYEWSHVPAGDIYDRETGSQYYYHAHPAEERPDEHGHFHTFLRPKGMPAGTAPAAVPGFRPPEDPNDALTHLVAIAMDRTGEPTKLFTTNRWVTGEVWYAAEDVCRCLGRFAVGHAQPSRPVNEWVTQMLVLFRPQIRSLVLDRDREVAAWQAAHPGIDPFEDRRLDVTAEIAIDVEAQIAAVERALGVAVA